jgi:prolyl-tRNA editing enzyme YbaK/EbsC (Cys-tRNA(Pro) deacylase)
MSAPGRPQALIPEPHGGEGTPVSAPDRPQALIPEPHGGEGTPVSMATLAERPEGFRRVAGVLAERGHPEKPVWLQVTARTSQEAADALGVSVGQIAKSVIFRRQDDDSAVLVVASGDRRVDERRVAALTGVLARADAGFVKMRTGFSIGGVAPLAHLQPVVTLIDRELFRFDEIWAAAGHPNGVFRTSPDQLVALTGAPVVDVAQVVR